MYSKKYPIVKMDDPDNYITKPNPKNSPNWKARFHYYLCNKEDHDCKYDSQYEIVALFYTRNIDDRDCKYHPDSRIRMLYYTRFPGDKDMKLDKDTEIRKYYYTIYNDPDARLDPEEEINQIYWLRLSY